MTKWVLDLPETFTFTNKEPLVINDLVASLRALEHISSAYLPAVLSKLTGHEVMAVEALVEGFEHGSFMEKVVYRLVFADEESMNRCFGHLRQLNVKAAFKEWSLGLGGDMSTDKSNTILISAAVLLLVASGIYIGSQLVGSDPASKELIKGNNNVIITIGAGAFEKSPEEVSEIIAEAVSSHRKKIAQDSVDFVAPARREKGAGVLVKSGEFEAAIPPDVIQAAPSDISKDPHEQEEEFRDVDLQIRATDMDSATRGWAALIPDLINRRVKLVLDDGVDAKQLAGKFSVRADVRILYRMDARSEKLRPVQITVLSIVDEG